MNSNYCPPSAPSTTLSFLNLERPSPRNPIFSPLRKPQCFISLLVRPIHINNCSSWICYNNDSKHSQLLNQWFFWFQGLSSTSKIFINLLYFHARELSPWKDAPVLLAFYPRSKRQDAVSRNLAPCLLWSYTSNQPPRECSISQDLTQGIELHRDHNQSHRQ